ncbi:MAG: chorismate mutase [Brevundimonas sp.]|uniref:chorismate mutase n=1 Tax=Brevundimonas sp. TaxID=1871086 RepID=UPI0024874545|nr:chorismate mutase [Brevundimonas sp.]MDI1328475.1 chorismate mutase [Brevundimonas sp.]
MSASELAARRARIDRIDAVLVRLVAARQRQVVLIAGLKAGPDRVRDPERIADILARVRAAARRYGLDEATAVPVWRELLERSAEAQQALLRAPGSIGRLDQGQAAPPPGRSPTKAASPGADNGQA